VTKTILEQPNRSWNPNKNIKTNGSVGEVITLNQLEVIKVWKQLRCSQTTLAPEAEKWGVKTRAAADKQNIERAKQ
jgi:hypothetical protein